MARRPDPETQVSVGYPVLPHGIQVTVSVKLSQVQHVTEHLLEWAKRNEGIWAQLPTHGPDVIPGGTPVNGWSDYDESEGRGRMGFR